MSHFVFIHSASVTVVAMHTLLCEVIRLREGKDKQVMSKTCCIAEY